MNQTLPTPNPAGACARGDHARCLDADQQCSCRCHGRGGLTTRDFRTSGSGTEIHEADRESDETAAVTVDEIARVSDWLGVPGHVLVAMHNGDSGDLGASYWVGWNDALAHCIDNADTDTLISTLERCIARGRQLRDRKRGNDK